MAVNRRRVAVTVGDSDRYTFLRCRSEDPPAKMMKMAVNDTVWTVQPEQPTELPSVRPWPMGAWTRYDSSS